MSMLIDYVMKVIDDPLIKMEGYRTDYDLDVNWKHGSRNVNWFNFNACLVILKELKKLHP